jgi:hypothetical protein
MEPALAQELIKSRDFTILCVRFLRLAGHAPAPRHYIFFTETGSLRAKGGLLDKLETFATMDKFRARFTDGTLAENSDDDEEDHLLYQRAREFSDLMRDFLVLTTNEPEACFDPEVPLFRRLSDHDPSYAELWDTIWSLTTANPKTWARNRLFAFVTYAGDQIQGSVIGQPASVPPYMPLFPREIPPAK